jgi:protein TonB
MSHIVSQTGPPFRDALSARLRLAVIASLLLNLALWSMAAAVAKHPPAYDPRPVEITRVIINQQGKKIEKVIKKEEIKKRIEQIRKPIPPPQPRPLAHVPPPPQSHHSAPPKPATVTHAGSPPPGAHNRVLLAQVDKTAPPPAPNDQTALPDGNAEQGKVIDQQNPGNAAVNPPQPVVKAPDPKPEPVPAPVTKTPEPTPAPVVKAPEPKPEPTPAPAPEPKHKGPTRDAEPTDQVKPEIPDDLKQQGGYKSFVRVRVVVDADGSATTVLRTSSGNTDIDNRVLEALKRWKWKPALKDGLPVQSTQLFKFEFLVE